MFSREAVLQGACDKYAEANEKKRGTVEVAAAFLADVEEWRSQLAHNLALRNPELSQPAVNVAVQRTIDRIIFLRICEDRGIERYGRLQALQDGPKTYARLCELFRQADDRYNSGLFHLTAEQERHATPDAGTLSLSLDDAILKNIVRKLYYPDSPYEFSVIGAEILGQVYERFLGKVIRLTAGHRAVIQDKPEVKKAGGVYYTPTYIVDYIVRNTVGKLLEGQTPEQVRAVKQRRSLSILDPACGSGAFLIGAYQYLLDWYRDWYVAHDPRKHKAGIYQADKGQWRLTIAERKRILLDHIYGVDIDPQAVEVTKLSLLLKVLEAENKDTIALQRRSFHERALPDLGDNVKCGNALIGHEFFGQQQLAFLQEDERLRVNVFDWAQAGFPEAMQAGGFDVVIGNPPYIRMQGMKAWAPLEVEFYRRHFRAASRGNCDIYVVFVERGLSLLTPRGRLGFILPHKFFNAEYGAPVRELLSQGRHLAHIVHFGAQQVFPGATTYTCLLFLNKSGSRQCRFVRVPDLAEWIQTGAGLRGEIAAEKINGAVWNFTVGDGAALVERLKAMPVRLGDVADIFVGLQTSADDVFILELVEETARSLRLRSKALNETRVFEKALFHPLVSGTDVKSYSPLPNRQYILFPYVVNGEQASLLDFAQLQDEYPRTAAYLLENKHRLAARERNRFRGANWYRFGRSQNLGIQARSKLCVPRLVDVLHAAYDDRGSHFLDNVDVGGVTLKPTHTTCDLRYLLALLNSKLLAWLFPHISAPFRGNWMSANRQFLSQLPIYVTDDSLALDKTRSARLLKLADQLLGLHKPASLRTLQEQASFSRQVSTLTIQIDQIVYELYGLNEEEIQIVEDAASR